MLYDDKLCPCLIPTPGDREGYDDTLLKDLNIWYTHALVVKDQHQIVDPLSFINEISRELCCKNIFYKHSCCIGLVQY